MSLGLLDGYGTDSNSDNDEDEDNCRTKENETLKESSSNQLSSGAPLTDHPLVNTLKDNRVIKEHSVTSYGLSDEFDKDTDTSSSFDSEDEEEEENDDKLTGRSSSPLPLPILDGSARLTSSVFSNPYKEAEEAKLNVLRRHVDLSNNVELAKERKKRSKGRRRGREWEARDGETSGDSQYWTDGDTPVAMPGIRGGARQGQKKYRAGVGESLRPPKKFMKIYKQIRNEEQPWKSH